MKLKLKPNPFTLSVGDRGEMMAWGYLVRHGYRILDKNYHCQIGEIDAVAEKDGRVFFIEIKTRRTTRFGTPEEAVHAGKQKRLIRLAAWYLKEKRKENAAVGFSVLSILDDGRKTPQLRLIEHAFATDGELNPWR